MSEYKDFSSMTPEKEAHFVVFEKTSVEALKKARLIATVVATIFLVAMMSIVYSHDPPANHMAHDADLAGGIPVAEEAAATPEATPPAAEGAGEGEAAPAGDGEAAAAGEGDKGEAAAAGEGDKGEAAAAGEGDNSGGDK